MKVDQEKLDIVYGRATRRGKDYSPGDLRADLEAAFGIAEHPKADRLFSMAWEYGHSAGVQEVVLHYSEFVELVS